MMKKLILGLATLMALTFVACEEEKETFMVTFDSNGGTEILSQTIEEGDTVVKPTDPTMEGYVFQSWTLEGEEYDFSTPVKSQFELLASWDKAVKIIDFEGVELNSEGLFDRDTVPASIAAGNSALSYSVSKYNGVFYYSGFNISNQDDITTAGYTNPYSCIAGAGANSSSNFAVTYGNRDSIKFNAPVDMESVMLCNNTYAALSMTNGDFVAKKFEAGDYFKLTVNLFDASGASLGAEDFYLADFRDGKSVIVKEWTQLDLSTYKGVSYLKFAYESTDLGTYGINTPTYFCIDNIAYYEAE